MHLIHYKELADTPGTSCSGLPEGGICFRESLVTDRHVKLARLGTASHFCTNFWVLNNIPCGNEKDGNRDIGHVISKQIKERRKDRRTGGRKEGRKGGKTDGRMEGRDAGRKEGRKGGREGGRERVREGGRKEGREAKSERGRELFSKAWA